MNNSGNDNVSTIILKIENLCCYMEERCLGVLRSSSGRHHHTNFANPGSDDRIEESTSFEKQWDVMKKRRGPCEGSKEFALVDDSVAVTKGLGGISLPSFASKRASS